MGSLGSGMKLDIEHLIDVLVESTIKFVKIQCSVSVSKKTLFLEGKKPLFSTDITAKIPLKCSKWLGELRVSFPKETYFNLLEKMLGVKYTEITSEIEDASKEILNIVYGTSKAILNKEGYDFGLAIPVVEKEKVSHSNINPVLIVVFQTSVGEFYLSVTITNIVKKAS